MAGKARYVKIKIDGTDIAIYASPKHQEAIKILRESHDVYGGVRVFQLFEEAYRQGRKDGAKEAFANIDKQVAGALAASKKAVPHKNPGQPRKK
jgi:hypothetical protein